MGLSGSKEYLGVEVISTFKQLCKKENHKCKRRNQRMNKVKRREVKP